MDIAWKEILWNQFGASIDMLENALVECPDELWNSDSQFWYIGYHSLFFLDYYLSDNPENFMPPAPFTLSEFDPSGLLPERVYSKEELLEYLEFCRKKCHNLLIDLSAVRLTNRFVNAYKNYPVLEILIYNMRHVQHHAAQLNLLLRQEIDYAPAWVARTKESL
ncbi:MAG: DinB family protein [Bacteroidota bacterium]|nr:DinB family protein [Bacteroidota bacterium]